MALNVTQRTHELGIRMALGAGRGEILWSVVAQGFSLALAGAVFGALGSFSFTQVLHTLLYETSSTDVGTFAGVTVVFLAVAAVASYLPARRVTSIDPLIALREE
jgi:ABC-type antimicrobial peptide transport system permease subunit